MSDSCSPAKKALDLNGNSVMTQSPEEWIYIGEEDPDKANITFSGCGFLGIYHIGVISCLKQHAPQYLKHFTHFGGASAGALSACTLMFNMDLESCVQFVMKLAGKARNNLLGPLSQDFDPVGIIQKVFTKFLPENAHVIATGKLHISMTRVCDWKNVIMSEYKSNQELVDALICTSFVPFYSGIKPPKFRGTAYIDGGFTDNMPQHFKGTTITVSPFSGESDICPDDANETLWCHFDMRNTSVQFTPQNLYRMSRAFFPPNQDVLCAMCRQGFKDALKYLHLHYPEMLNIGIARIRIPDCCNECQDSEDDRSVCSCSTAENLCDIESTISAERQIMLHNVVPEALNEVLQKAREVIIDTDIILWHMVKVFLRIAKWLARPCIYTVKHLIEFARELAHWVIPKVQEISDQNYYTKTVVNIALEIFNTYKDRHQCERHPSLNDTAFTDIAEATAKLKDVQRHMRVVPISQSQSRRRLTSSQSMYSLPYRKTSLPASPTTPTKSVPPPRKFSESSAPQRQPITPPNMGYLGLSPRHETHSRTPLSKKSLELLLEAGEFEQSEKIFKVGSCKAFYRIDELSGEVDSFDEFVNDFVFVDDDESDCDFH